MSQSGVELLGMQFAKGGAAGGGFSELAVPRAAVGKRRVEGAAAGAGEDRVGEDAAGGREGG